MSNTITIYSTGTCPYCDRAKMLLNKRGLEFNEVRVDQSQQGLQEMQEKTNNARTVPQIIINEHLVGGFDNLTEYDMDGRLAKLLAGETL